VEVKIFSRHLEDMTDKYPDVVILVKQYCQDPSLSELGGTSFIIDSEIVAWDTQKGIIKSFQELSNRPRKDVKLHQVSIPVCLFVFDLMYLNHEVCYIDMESQMLHSS
jgi:DNA ligase-1